MFELAIYRYYVTQFSIVSNPAPYNTTLHLNPPPPKVLRKVIILNHVNKLECCKNNHFNKTIFNEIRFLFSKKNLFYHLYKISWIIKQTNMLGQFKLTNLTTNLLITNLMTKALKQN